MQARPGRGRDRPRCAARTRPWRRGSSRPGKGSARASALRTDGSGGPCGPSPAPRLRRPIGRRRGTWAPRAPASAGRSRRRRSRLPAGAGPGPGRRCRSTGRGPANRGEDEGLSELAPPDPVERGRKQVVEQVVAAGDPAEHRPDPGSVLLLQRLDCGSLCEDFRPGFRHDVREVYRGGAGRTRSASGCGSVRLPAGLTASRAIFMISGSLR